MGGMDAGREEDSLNQHLVGLPWDTPPQGLTVTPKPARWDPADSTVFFFKTSFLGGRWGQDSRSWQFSLMEDVKNHVNK